MRNVRILIAMIAVSLLVVPAAFAQVKPPQTAPVPNVAGMSLSDAQKSLVSAGFNAIVTQENVTDPGKNNVVLKQQIPHGTTLAKGSNVPIVVGKFTAPAQQPVPNVVGIPLDKAQAALSQAKLNAAVTMQPVDQPQRNNVVLAQNVPAGKTLSPGSTVPIVVGKYTAPTPVPVPNVVGMKLGEAQATLSKAKLNAQVTIQPVDQPQRNDVVLTQQIASGKALSPGSMVPIVVGKYTASTVPNVVGMKLGDAQAALAKVKLNAVVTMEKVNDKNKNGIVLKQQIATGSALVPGAQVPLIVGQYQEPVHVPSVVGMTEMQAETALKQAKLNASFGLRAATDRKKIGTVLEQNIAPGTAVEPGSQIIVVIGLDPSSKILQPQNNRPYPNRPYLTNPAIPADKQN
jgi:beta-lactam-binding protein with PASTA domain